MIFSKDRIVKILKRLRRIFAQKFSGKASTSSISIVSNNSLNGSNGEERTVVEIYDNVPKTEFEPVERQRHFGILHYTVNNRFRKMMLIGVINVILILAFFLFMFFFVVQKKNDGDGNDRTTSTFGTRVMTTSKPQYYDPPILQLFSLPETTICTNNFVLVNEKCLKLNTTLYSKPTAQTICNQIGATLLKIENEKENHEFTSFLHKQNISNVWMGLICDSNSMNSCHWDGGSTLSYSNFSSGSPNSIGKCVSFSSNGQWKSESCNAQLPFVCQLPTTSKDNCTYNYNHHCYLQFNQPLSFSNAQSKCQKLCANLPSIHSSEENLYLTSIYKFANQNLLLGGFASSQKSVYWIDNSKMDYINFNSFDTHSSCIVSRLGDGGVWESCDCSQSLPSFICKRPTGIKCS